MNHGNHSHSQRNQQRDRSVAFRDASQPRRDPWSCFLCNRWIRGGSSLRLRSRSRSNQRRNRHQRRRLHRHLQRRLRQDSRLRWRDSGHS
jgi:hypothetical protein